MNTFQDFRKLTEVAPLGKISRIIVFGDGSGRIESDSGNTVADFETIEEADELIGRLFTKYNKPLVKGQRVSVLYSANFRPGEEGEVVSFDKSDNTYAVKFDNGDIFFFLAKSLRAIEVVRKVGEEVHVLETVDEDDETWSGRGVIVKTDAKDRDLPYWVWVESMDQTRWFNEDSLA